MDLAAYLERIGLSAPPPPTVAGLATLQHAHRRSIPFENLDIPLGRGISLDPNAVSAKLIDARRGGYCFEHNALFLVALSALGFTVRALLGRVWLDRIDVPPRTHTLSLVTIDGGDWIADAGFGGGDVPPLPLEDGAVAVTGGVEHKLCRDREHSWMLSRNGQPQYSFTEERVYAPDLAMANHWVSTSPHSRHTARRVVSIVVDGGLVSLTGTRLSPDGAAIELADAAAYRAALADRFGIEVSMEEAVTLFDG